MDDEENRKPTTKNVRRLFGLLRPYAAKLLEGTLACIFATAMMMALPWAGKILIDDVMIGRDLQLMWVVIGAVLGLSVFRLLFIYVGHYTISYYGQKFILNLRRRLFDHLQALSMDFYERTKTGKLLSRVMSDIGAIQTFVNSTFRTIVDQMLVILIGLVILFSINWKLALVALAVFPFYGLTSAKYKRPIRDRAKEVRVRWSILFGNLAEVLSGTKVVKSFAAENRERRFFLRDLVTNLKTQMDYMVTCLRFGMLNRFIIAVGTVLVMGVGTIFVIRGIDGMTVGTYVAFTSYVSMLFAPISILIDQVNVFLAAMAGVDRMFEVLDARPAITEVDDAIVLEPLRGAIRFRDVRFSYDGENEVLKGISFDVEPGQVVAFVGPSGSGKSTIASLLARFYDPNAGRITVDGYDLKTLKLKPYRRQIGTVLQDNFLFSGTLADNIRYSRPEATDDEVEWAAREANIADFIESQPDGYQTEVGENGVKLSGGQKQRIAIARALLRDPKLLILDEATSSLDTTSEKLIQEALNRLMAGRTTLVIAHRLSTIRSADVIYVLKDGHIVQSGTHDELMQHRDGLYRSLYLGEGEADGSDRAVDGPPESLPGRSIPVEAAA